MKLKEGQKVRVNRNLKDIENFEHSYMEEMSKLEGKIVTISRIDSDEDIKVKEDEYGYWWDKRAFSPLKITKQELLDMPVGTKIYTDAEDKDYREYIKKNNRNFDGVMTTIIDSDIEEDLTITDSRCGSKIIKIETPIYETVWDYSEEVQEMTIAEIEKVLGHAVKIIKEDN